MGKNKDAAIGFGVIVVIIAVIVGIVLAVLPEESETAQNELEENQQITTQEESKIITQESQITTQEESQIRLLKKIQEQEKELQYIEGVKQKDQAELDFVDKAVLENPQKYKEPAEQRLKRLNSLKQQGLGILDTEEEILDYVFSYRGKDNQGNDLRTEFVLYVIGMYPEVFSNENPFLKDHRYYVVTAVDSGSIEISIADAVAERYRYAHFLIFKPVSGDYKTVFTFLFDTETYEIFGDNEHAKLIIEELDTNS